MRKLILYTILVSSCFNTPTGQKKDDDIRLDKIWSSETNIIAAPVAPPLVIGNAKVIYSGEIELKAIDINTGVELWAGQIDNQRALIGYILLYDEELNRVLSTHMEDFKAWDANTGESIFSLSEEDSIYAYALGDNTILKDGYGVIAERSDTYVLNQDGSIRFEIDISFGTSGVAYSENMIYLTQGKTINGGLTEGKVRGFDSQNGDSLWAYHTEHGGFISAAPLLHQGVLYAGTRGNSLNSLIVALSPELGNVIWEYVSDEPKEFTASLILGPNLVYSGASGALIALDKLTGQKKWRFDWIGSTIVRPVYLEGYIYHSDHNRLFVLDAETGELVHEEPVPEGGSYFWHLAVSSDKLIIQTSTQIIAFQPWHLREE